MIQWASRLYISDNLKKRKDKAIASINSRRMTYDVYCIAFASSPNNLFDIMNANELLFPYYLKTDVRIVGLAKGSQEAAFWFRTCLWKYTIKLEHLTLRNTLHKSVYVTIIMLLIRIGG